MIKLIKKKKLGERIEFMNSEELKSIIESAREAKSISQRELAKLSGISRSTLNDIINGKIKK
ncbi:MAG TPA: helix-turn-helix transcriptional regulator [Candidatus Faecisoma merdavium]|nr:helix-turn-helix transcriptional regulator [Candidatus Faecisoma merdavium]